MGRERGSTEELISQYIGIFGRIPQHRRSDVFPETIVVSWESVAEIWLDPTDSTADFVIIDWHDPSAPLATKYAAYGAALDYGVDVNADPGVQHIAMLTRLLGIAPERVREA